MLETQLTLGNISCVLLNLTKRFLQFSKALLPSIAHAVNSHVFLFSWSITAAARFNFCSFALFVWLMSWYANSVGRSLFMGCLRIALAFSVLTITHFYFKISTRWYTCYYHNSSKVSGHLFIVNQHNIIFIFSLYLILYLILMLVVSHINLLHIHVSNYTKNDCWSCLFYQ